MISYLTMHRQEMQANDTIILHFGTHFYCKKAPKMLLLFISSIVLYTKCNIIGIMRLNILYFITFLFLLLIVAFLAIAK